MKKKNLPGQGVRKVVDLSNFEMNRVCKTKAQGIGLASYLSL